MRRRLLPMKQIHYVITNLACGAIASYFVGCAASVEPDETSDMGSFESELAVSPPPVGVVQVSCPGSAKIAGTSKGPATITVSSAPKVLKSASCEIAEWVLTCNDADLAAAAAVGASSVATQRCQSDVLSSFACEGSCIKQVKSDHCSPGAPKASTRVKCKQATSDAVAWCEYSATVNASGTDTVQCVDTKTSE